MRTPWFHHRHHDLRVGRCTLSPEESHHACTTRRLREGDAVVVFDGRGRTAHGHVASVRRDGVEIDIAEISTRPRSRLQLTLAVAPPKGARQDVLVEKCTELGVAALWPLHCRRSVVRLPADRVERWRRAALEACKQCRRAWLPEIAAPQDFGEVLARAAGFDLRWLAEPDGRDPAPWPRSDRAILAIVGPEGGLTQEESDAARAAGFTAVALGARVLRVETAAIALAARAAID